MRQTVTRYIPAGRVLIAGFVIALVVIVAWALIFSGHW